MVIIKFKRIISVLLAITLLAGYVFMPAPLEGTLSVSAEEISGDFKYTLDKDGNAIITAYTGNEAVLKVPGTLCGHKVTCAFGCCKSLKEIAVDKGNTAYISVDGILYSKDKSSPICSFFLFAVVTLLLPRQQKNRY